MPTWFKVFHSKCRNLTLSSCLFVKELFHFCFYAFGFSFSFHSAHFNPNGKWIPNGFKITTMSGDAMWPSNQFRIRRTAISENLASNSTEFIRSTPFYSNTFYGSDSHTKRQCEWDKIEDYADAVRNRKAETILIEWWQRHRVFRKFVKLNHRQLAHADIDSCGYRPSISWKVFLNERRRE